LSSTLFINSKIWQEDFTFKKSFGIKNGIISFVSDENSPSHKNEFDKIIDLRGKLVLPSFIDGHVHLAYGSLMMKRIDCSDVKNIDELKRKVNEYSKKNPTAQWLVGGNLNIPHLKSQLNPAGNLLDDIYSSKPVFLNNYDYHSGICNSAALKISGLHDDIADYSEDEIIRINGKPTGEIKEKAKEFIFNFIPSPSLKNKTEAVSEMIKILHSYGITGVSDITLPENFEVYKALNENNQLKLKINSYIPFSSFHNFDSIQKESGISKTRLEIKGFKAYYDGALGSGTGLFKDNYKGGNYPGYKTEQALSGEIDNLAFDIDNAGKQIIIHAIGDKAVYEVLQICSKLNETNGRKDRRFRIEHAQHIDEADFWMFKELGVIASAQPLHLKYDANLVKEKLIEKVQKRTHNYKALIDKGVVVNFGTDFPIVEINPFHNIHMAVTREYNDGIFYPEYKIDLHNCIKCYTINNAFASFDDKITGSITAGKKANFIIMNEDLFEIPKDEIKNASVYETYFEGEEIKN
jgi:predicted amidohydrolase YtcJ